MRAASWLLIWLLATTPVAAETVTLGAEDDWFPYSGLVNKQVQGITIDVVRAAFAVSGIEVRYEVLPYARCMALTKSGALPACFDTLRNPGIENDYLWHDPAMFRVQYKIYALASSNESDLHPRDLEGKKVAVTRAYEYGVEFDTNEKIQRVLTSRDESNFGMVLRGRAQYTVALEINTAMLMARRPDLAGKFKVVGAVEASEVHMAFSRRHPDAKRLMGLFEKGLRELHANGRIRAIEEAWFRKLGGTAATRN